MEMHLKDLLLNLSVHSADALQNVQVSHGYIKMASTSVLYIQSEFGRLAEQYASNEFRQSEICSVRCHYYTLYFFFLIQRIVDHLYWQLKLLTLSNLQFQTIQYQYICGFFFSLKLKIFVFSLLIWRPVLHSFISSTKKSSLMSCKDPPAMTMSPAHAITWINLFKIFHGVSFLLFLLLV